VSAALISDAPAKAGVTDDRTDATLVSAANFSARHESVLIWYFPTQILLIAGPAPLPDATEVSIVGLQF